MVSGVNADTYLLACESFEQLEKDIKTYFGYHSSLSSTLYLSWNHRSAKNASIKNWKTLVSLSLREEIPHILATIESIEQG